MRSIMALMAFAGMFAVLSGCETTTEEKPLYDPFIRGTITAIDGNTIRVEEKPAEEFRGNKALLRITRDTIILDSSGDRVTQSALAVGQLVSAWITGPVAESYPVRATASVISIEPDVAPL